MLVSDPSKHSHRDTGTNAGSITNWRSVKTYGDMTANAIRINTYVIRRATMVDALGRYLGHGPAKIQRLDQAGA
jgi:hypothetical protein